jgi:hypothetical protein
MVGWTAYPRDGVTIQSANAAGLLLLISIEGTT